MSELEFDVSTRLRTKKRLARRDLAKLHVDGTIPHGVNFESLADKLIVSLILCQQVYIPSIYTFFGNPSYTYRTVLLYISHFSASFSPSTERSLNCERSALNQLIISVSIPWKSFNDYWYNLNALEVDLEYVYKITENCRCILIKKPSSTFTSLAYSCVRPVRLF